MYTIVPQNNAEQFSLITFDSHNKSRLVNALQRQDYKGTATYYCLFEQKRTQYITSEIKMPWNLFDIHAHNINDFSFFAKFSENVKHQ